MIRVREGAVGRPYVPSSECIARAEQFESALRSGIVPVPPGSVVLRTGVATVELLPEVPSTDAERAMRFAKEIQAELTRKKLGRPR